MVVVKVVLSVVVSDVIIVPVVWSSTYDSVGPLFVVSVVKSLAVIYVSDVLWCMLCKLFSQLLLAM